MFILAIRLEPGDKHWKIYTHKIRQIKGGLCQWAWKYDLPMRNSNERWLTLRTDFLKSTFDFKL